MSVKKIELLFWRFLFANCLYCAKANLLEVVENAEAVGVSNYKYIFYHLCHLDTVKRDFYLTILEPHPILPLSEKDVTFWFHSRENPTVPKVIPALASASNIASLGIDFSKETLLFCNGFAFSSLVPRILLPSVLLPQKDMNIIITDWDSYAYYNILYTSNLTTNLLGDVIGNFLHKLIDAGLDPKKTTLMGFSVGSQAVALAAKQIRPKVARILAFSPDGTCFNFQPDSQRLVASDADYVVMVHCTSGIYGYDITHMGDATFYINGGVIQPHCVLTPTAGLENLCSHLTGMLYAYGSVLNLNIFKGVKCPTYVDYLQNKCDCNNVAFLKYDISSSVRGLYFIDTAFSSNTPCLPKLPLL